MWKKVWLCCFFRHCSAKSYQYNPLYNALYSTPMIKRKIMTPYDLLLFVLFFIGAIPMAIYYEDFFFFATNSGYKSVQHLFDSFVEREKKKYVYHHRNEMSSHFHTIWLLLPAIHIKALQVFFGPYTLWLKYIKCIHEKIQ